MTDESRSRNRSTIAVITGGTHGVGLAIAKRLALEGRGIVIGGRNTEKFEAAAASVRSLWTDCLFAKADVWKADDCHRLVAYMLSPESGVITGALVDYDQNVAGAYPEYRSALVEGRLISNLEFSLKMR
jgi:NAD(P)-dependent dehydrogenase (short-subunit alcohol dehydrogenase family)